jgi:hypothetical protein
MADPAGGDARDQDMIAGQKGRDGCANLFDNPHTFMAKDPARRAGWYVSFQDMQVGPAYRSVGYPDDGIACGLNPRIGMIVEALEPWSMIYQCFHGAISFARQMRS